MTYVTLASSCIDACLCIAKNSNILAVIVFETGAHQTSANSCSVPPTNSGEVVATSRSRRAKMAETLNVRMHTFYSHQKHLYPSLRKSTYLVLVPEGSSAKVDDFRQNIRVPAGSRELNYSSASLIPCRQMSDQFVQHVWDPANLAHLRLQAQKTRRRRRKVGSISNIGTAGRAAPPKPLTDKTISTLQGFADDTQPVRTRVSFNP